MRLDLSLFLFLTQFSFPLHFGPVITLTKVRERLLSVLYFGGLLWTTLFAEVEEAFHNQRLDRVRPRFRRQFVKEGPRLPPGREENSGAPG